MESVSLLFLLIPSYGLLAQSSSSTFAAFEKTLESVPRLLEEGRKAMTPGVDNVETAIYEAEYGVLKPIENFCANATNQLVHLKSEFGTNSALRNIFVVMGNELDKICQRIGVTLTTVQSISNLDQWRSVSENTLYPTLDAFSNTLDTILQPSREIMTNMDYLSDPKSIDRLKKANATLYELLSISVRSNSIIKKVVDELSPNRTVNVTLVRQALIDVNGEFVAVVDKLAASIDEAKDAVRKHVDLVEALDRFNFLLVKVKNHIRSDIKNVTKAATQMELHTVLVSTSYNFIKTLRNLFLALQGTLYTTMTGVLSSLPEIAAMIEDIIKTFRDVDPATIEPIINEEN